MIDVNASDIVLGFCIKASSLYIISSEQYQEEGHV